MSGITVKNFAAYETIPLTCVANTSVSAKFKLQGSFNLPDIMVVNNGSTIAFVGYGSSITQPSVTVAAQAPGLTGTTNCTPILPGAIMVLSKDEIEQSDTVCAYSTGTSQLYFSSGVGN